MVRHGPLAEPERFAIVPDGCADLLWVDNVLVAAGPDQQAKVESVSPGKAVVGLQFRPGAPRRWLATPVSEITDARIPLEDFWGREARHLTDGMGQEVTPGKIVQQIVAALCEGCRASSLRTSRP